MTMKTIQKCIKLSYLFTIRCKLKPTEKQSAQITTDNIIHPTLSKTMRDESKVKTKAKKTLHPNINDHDLHSNRGQ